MLLVFSGLAPGRPPATDATVALVAHFERPPGQHILHWLAPMIAKVFRPAGLSLEWYATRDAAPANAARILDVWFHGACWPIAPRDFWSPPLQSVHLGWVLSHDGHITGDIFVDCALIMQFAAGAGGATTTRTLLDVAFLRLLEHVLTHELLHVLFMSAGHGASDSTRPRMHASDWRQTGRLTDAEVQSLRRLYGPEASVAWVEKR